MNKIAICLTTFLRDELLYGTVANIIKYMPDNSFLYVADQGYETSEKAIFFKDLFSKTGKVFYYKLPYDCGLSYARNYLVDKAYLTNIDYCLITADSIRFMYKPELQGIIDGMTEDTHALVGLEIEDRIPWEWKLNLVLNKYFLLSKLKPRDILKYDKYVIKNVDICRNFFIAKTEALYKVRWDNNLKLAEHEDFFYRLKLSGYRCLWTNYIQGEYIDYKPEKYKAMRERMYTKYQYRVLKKYNIKQWIKLEE